MLLTIDAGNTNTVFAVFDAQGYKRGEWRASTTKERTADEYSVWLTQLFGIEGLKREDIHHAVIASVVPAGLFALKTLCRKAFGCSPLVVGEKGVELGVNALVDHPEEVGADRLVNALAAHLRFKEPVIVIDFGTATTFDVVDGQGNYLGGAIAPGVNLSLEALHMAAAQLPRVAVDNPGPVIGKSTVPAMKSGVFWGYIGLVEGLVARIKTEFGQPMTVLATGGLAPLFTQGTEVIDHLDPDLTQRGLLEVYRRNKQKG